MAELASNPCQHIDWRMRETTLISPKSEDRTLSRQGELLRSNMCSNARIAQQLTVETPHRITPGKHERRAMHHLSEACIARRPFRDLPLTHTHCVPTVRCTNPKELAAIFPG